MFSSALKSFSSNIQSNYSISPNPTAYSGPWKIYDGKKKSIGKEVSIFIFERKSLEPSSNGFGSRSSSSSVKRLQEEVVERLKREASSLARLRHPSLLELSEPVEETRSGGLMFATEPITASLAGLLRQEDDRERSSSTRSRQSSSNGAKKEFELDELEIQKGLLQIGKGLEFLHESAGLVHGNLTPDAIYVNAKGDWKIAGLAFTGPPDSSTNSNLPPLALSEVLHKDPRLPQSVQLNLDFSSPDFVMDSNVTASADLFSLGLIIITLYNSPHTSPIQTHGNQGTYKTIFGASSTVPSSKNNFLSTNPVPKDLVEHVLPRLITRRPANRMTAKEFQESQYFDNVLVSTIRFLESLPAKTPSEKAAFMKGLHRVLQDFPSSVLEKKVLGALLEEMKDKELLSPILQNIFKIIATIPSAKEVFPAKVIPRIKEIFQSGGAKSAAGERDTGKEAGLMIIMENMNVIAQNCPGKEFKDEMLPIVRLAIDSPTHALVDAALKSLPIMLPVLDFSTVKNDLFPVIASVFSKTSSLGIKVRGLEAFVVLCGGKPAEDNDSGDGLSGVMEAKPMKTMGSILDKYTVQEKVVPLLRSIKTKEPAVMMAALDVFKQVGQIADTDFLATSVLPILWTFSLGPLLNLEQFQSFMALIKVISSKIEREQTKKLQELGSAGPATIRDSTSTRAQGSNGVSATKRSDAAVENDFERLVLGRKAGTAKDDDPFGADWASESSTAPQPVNASANWQSRPSMSALTPTAPSLQSSFRSITPDSNMGGFPALQPAPKPMSPPAASISAFPAPANNVWASPITPPPNPSLATLGSMRSNSGSVPTMFSQPSQHQPQSSFSSFSILPPPVSPGSLTQPQYGNLGSMSSTPLQPQTMGSMRMGSMNNSQTSMMGQGSMMGGMGTNSMGGSGILQPQQPQPQQSQQKQGLDKYASLL